MVNVVPDIVKGNCHAHIVHNCVKYGMGFLTYDVENVILKIYSHFSVSACTHILALGGYHYYLVLILYY